MYGAVAVGLGLDPLRPFVALRAQFLGLALALGLHAVVRSPGWSRTAGRRGGSRTSSTETPSGAAFAATSVLIASRICPRSSVSRARERRLAERAARSRADDQAELHVRSVGRPQRLIEAERIDDPVAGVGLHLEPLLVAHDRLLDLRLEQQRAGRGHVDRVDERDLELRPGVSTTATGAPNRVTSACSPSLMT